MIQRVQSLFLAAVVIISIVLFYVPFSSKTSTDPVSGKTIENSLALIPSSAPGGTEASSVVEVNYILLLLNLIILAAAAFIIFQFNNRPAQMRLASLTGLFTGVFLALIFYFSDALVGEGKPHYLLGTYLVGIQVFFILAARRFIRKDEMLVRASQRIR